MKTASDSGNATATTLTATLGKSSATPKVNSSSGDRQNALWPSHLRTGRSVSVRKPARETFRELPLHVDADGPPLARAPVKSLLCPEIIYEFWCRDPLSSRQLLS